MILTLLTALALQASPDSEAGSDGPFQVLTLAVPDLDKFDREWAVPTEGAHVTSTSNLVRGKPTFVTVMMGGCATDAQGRCRIEVRHRLVDPSGQVYGGLDGSKGNPAQDLPSADGQYMLTPDVLGIEIEPDEPLGPYELTVTVRDLIANRTVVTKQTLTAIEGE